MTEMATADTDTERRAELAGNLAKLRSRVAAACEAAGRDRAGITLVAVTKTYPAADVLRLAKLGVRDIGENKDQEAAAKAAEVAGTGVDVRWHYIGQLQRRKCKSVATYAHLVHSVDRPELVESLANAVAEHRDGPLDVLLQVSLDGAEGRGGVPVPAVPALAETVGKRPELVLRGVMTVAPLDWAPERAFTLLAETAQRLRRDV